MENKTVKYLLPAQIIDMGGFPVKQPLPTQKVQQLDPFLLLHHARTKYSDRRPAKQQGVGPHPHRGFSPVTFVIEGEVHHRDSWGNDQVAGEGEVQWMHAGAGLVHSERPSQALVEGSRWQEIIQLWVNSPAESKMIPPSYHYLSDEILPKITSDDAKVVSKLIAGTYRDAQGPVPTQSDLLMLWGQGTVGGGERFEIPEGYNSMLYLIKGRISLKGYGLVEAEHLVVFDHANGGVELTLNEDAQFLLLCGRPLNEKVAQSGPFVMNTQTEVLEAMRDYQMGKMGILVEE